MAYKLAMFRDLTDYIMSKVSSDELSENKLLRQNQDDSSEANPFSRANESWTEKLPKHLLRLSSQNPRLREKTPFIASLKCVLYNRIEIFVPIRRASQPGEQTP
jgi:hypothetical protein